MSQSALSFQSCESLNCWQRWLSVQLWKWLLLDPKEPASHEGAQNSQQTLKPYLQNTIPTRRGKKEKDFPLWLVFLSLFCIIRRGQETRDLETFYLQPNYRSVLLTKLVENWLNVIQRISMRKNYTNPKIRKFISKVDKCNDRVGLLDKYYRNSLKSRGSNPNDANIFGKNRVTLSFRQGLRLVT